jgi:predicted ATP-dependent serine protease
MAAVDITSNGLSESVRPAEPLLASHSIDDKDLSELLESLCVIIENKEKDEKKRLRSGVKSLDDALSGGLHSGRIVRISGEAGAGASQVSNMNITVIENHFPERP